MQLSVKFLFSFYGWKISLAVFVLSIPWLEHFAMHIYCASCPRIHLSKSLLSSWHRKAFLDFVCTKFSHFRKFFFYFSFVTKLELNFVGRNNSGRSTRIPRCVQDKEMDNWWKTGLVFRLLHTFHCGETRQEFGSICELARSERNWERVGCSFCAVW